MRYLQENTSFMKVTVSCLTGLIWFKNICPAPYTQAQYKNTNNKTWTVFDFIMYKSNKLLAFVAVTQRFNN